MPIKKDETGKRWVEMEVLVPGTPEQVWRAVATGAGNTGWFTRTEIEEHVGGAVRFDFGPMGSSSGEVTDWAPPHRLGYVERDWSEGAPPVATEITITSHSGGRSVLRMVHSLYASTDDWDDQLEGFESGWPGLFEVLRVYLAHFGDKDTAFFGVLVMVDDDQLGVWKRLTEALRLDGANVGDQRATPAPPESLSGIVEHVRQERKQRWLIMRIDAPSPGIVMIGTYDFNDRVGASVGIHFYGDDAAQTAAASDTRWREWLNATFAPAGEAATPSSETASNQK